MSHTEIYGFDEDGDAFHHMDVEDSRRGAVAVWKALEERYLPPFRPPCVAESVSDSQIETFFQRKPSRTDSPCSEARLHEILNLYSDERLSETERIVLGTTLDLVIVQREDIPKVVEAFNAFGGETSLKEQAEILQELYGDSSCVAVAWNQISSNCDTWANRGGYNCASEECLPYNVIRQDDHWCLFEK